MGYFSGVAKLIADSGSIFALVAVRDFGLVFTLLLVLPPWFVYTNEGMQQLSGIITTTNGCLNVQNGRGKKSE